MKTRKRGMYPQLNEEYRNIVSDNIIYGERLNVPSLISRTRQGCPLSPLLLNKVLEVLTRQAKQGNRSDADWKERNKTV